MMSAGSGSTDDSTSLKMSQELTCVLKGVFDLVKSCSTAALPAIASALPALVLDVKNGVPEGLAFTTATTYLSLESVRSLLKDDIAFSHEWSIVKGLVAGLIVGSVAAGALSEGDTPSAKTSDGVLYGSMPLLGALATSAVVGLAKCCKRKCGKEPSPE